MESKIFQTGMGCISGLIYNNFTHVNPGTTFVQNFSMKKAEKRKFPVIRSKIVADARLW